MILRMGLHWSVCRNSARPAISIQPRNVFASSTSIPTHISCNDGMSLTRSTDANRPSRQSSLLSFSHDNPPSSFQTISMISSSFYLHSRDSVCLIRSIALCTSIGTLLWWIDIRVDLCLLSLARMLGGKRRWWYGGSGVTNFVTVGGVN